MVLAACFSTAFMAYGIRYSFGILLPEMMFDLGLTNAQAALIFSTFLATYTISSIFVGFLVDSLGIKRTMLTFLPILGIGTGLMSFVYTQLQGILFFAIAGVGASAGWIPLAIWVQRAYPSKRGWSLGILQIGVNLGFSTLGLATPLMTPYLGWRGVWGFLGALTLIWLLPLTAVAKEPEVSQHSQGSILTQLKGSCDVIRDERFWLGGISYTLGAFAIMVPMTFSKAYANLELGLNMAEATSLFSIIGFTGLVSAITIPIISDRIGRKLSIIICHSATTVGLIGLAFFSTTFVDIALWSAVVGVGYSTIWPLYAALVRDLYSWDIAGSVLGLWTVLCGLGFLLSPYISGILIDNIGSYKPAYAMGCVVAVAAVISILKIKIG